MKIFIDYIVWASDKKVSHIHHDIITEEDIIELARKKYEDRSDIKEIFDTEISKVEI